MRLAGRDDADRLDSYARRVRSGDNGNLEGQAAAFYFTQLFGKDFYRDQERFTNAALDYGYAVLRGAIARGLVAHGLLPSIGLFHASEQNAFNLADDVIEPFRPLVDLLVAKYVMPADDELRPEDKVALVGLLNVDVGMPRGKMSALSAIEQTIESLARIYDGGNETLLELPSIIGLEQHRLEC
jgi:CRISPR-associated protein Cas1